VLHKFRGGDDDGAVPFTTLIAPLGDALYGTTAYGGGKGSCLFGGCGTVFKITLP